MTYESKMRMPEDRIHYALQEYCAQLLTPDNRMVKANVYAQRGDVVWGAGLSAEGEPILVTAFKNKVGTYGYHVSDCRVVDLSQGVIPVASYLSNRGLYDEKLAFDIYGYLVDRLSEYEPPKTLTYRLPERLA